MPRYSIFQPPVGDQYCAITKVPEDMPNPARPAHGTAMEATYPGPIDFSMSALVKGIKIPDVINNAFGYLMVSEKVQAILAAEAGAAIEFLPFRLLNHKGRVAAERCFIANVLGAVDCGDMSKSQGTPFPKKPDVFFDAKRLAIFEDKVPAEAKIFRTKLYTAVTFVREDLRTALEKAKLTCRFVNPGDPLL
jgi:hypothetical protein